MKIIIEPLSEGAEEEIIIRSNSLDSELMELIYSLKAGRSKLTAFNDDEILKLAPSDTLCPALHNHERHRNHVRLDGCSCH